MKKMNRYILFVFALLSELMAQAQGLTQAQSLLITIDEIDSIVTQRNLQLQASRFDVDAAEALLAQARTRENPEVQLMHNVQNPMNRKWFDMGYDGQTDVQVSQPIAIGGQYKNKVRQARANLNASRAAYETEVLNVRHEARTTFIDLYYAQQKFKVYDKEIASVEKIYQAYDEQMNKGNVSKMETFRVAAMLSQLRAEKAELLLSVDEQQSKLCLLLNLTDATHIKACLDEEATIAEVGERLTMLRSTMLSSNAEMLKAMVERHPQIAQAKCEEESARHAIKVEKADALPRIALNGEWDKNGSIGHNFFAIGATLSVPLWNRNQGNIRAAKAQYAQATIERQQRQNEVQATMMMLVNATAQHFKQVEDNRQHLSANLDLLLMAAEEQFLKRNLSVLEFVDLYNSYRDTHFMVADAKAQLLKSNEELKKYIR